MPKPRKQVCALTIAGSDSGGGAGIQADLKTFAAHGVHGVTALTCVTAQNPARVTAIQAMTPALVRSQLDAVSEAFSPRAAKTGMLYSTAIIRSVMEWLDALKNPPALVVDPVMVATSGARLLHPAALKLMAKELLPRATLITPNRDEAALLLGSGIHSLADLREAAQALQREFGCAVLAKGGHLEGTSEATDVFFDGRKELLLTAPLVQDASTHGTGCTLSAALTAQLALGRNLRYASRMAKQFISRAIAKRTRVEKHEVLNPFWQKAPKR